MGSNERRTSSQTCSRKDSKGWIVKRILFRRSVCVMIILAQVAVVRVRYLDTGGRRSHLLVEYIVEGLLRIARPFYDFLERECQSYPMHDESIYY